MAEYHLSLKVGSKGKTAPHFNYIYASGKYAAKRGVEHIEHGNMPIWAVGKPVLAGIRQVRASQRRRLPETENITAKRVAVAAAYSFALSNTTA